MSTRRLSPVLALCAVAGFGALLAAELRQRDAPAPPRVARLAAEITDGDLALPPRPTLDATQEIVTRPLFFPSRRPLPPEPVAVAEARPEPPPVLDFALVGTVLTAKSQIALIKPDKSAPLQVELGQDVGRWTVTSIGADRIVVRNGAVEQLVGLREFGSAARALPASMHPTNAAPAVARAPDAPAPPPPSSPIRRAGTRR